MVKNEAAMALKAAPANGNWKQNSSQKPKQNNDSITVLCRRMAGSNWQNAPEAKQQVARQQTKPENEKINSEPQIASQETNPENKNRKKRKRRKPQVNSQETKPENEKITSKPQVASQETKPENEKEINSEPQVASQETKPENEKKKKSKPRRPVEKWTKFVAMDCEMVGTGENGEDDMLARVSIVNQNGDLLMDKYVKAQEEVVDYRTKVSGIRPHNMENGEEFSKVQHEVRQILHEKVLVGHAVKHDLAVLKMKHPHQHIRDTANYRPLAKLVSNGATPSLKRLAKAILGKDIQMGEHSSVEDARACMLVYVRFSAEWERYLKRLLHNRSLNHRKRRS